MTSSPNIASPAWVHDYGGPSLRYADRYDIVGVDFFVLLDMFEDGASSDDIVLSASTKSPRTWMRKTKRTGRSTKKSGSGKSGTPSDMPSPSSGSAWRCGLAGRGWKACGMTTRASTTARGYGGQHQALRKRVAAIVAFRPRRLLEMRASDPARDGMGSRP